MTDPIEEALRAHYVRSGTLIPLPSKPKTWRDRQRERHEAQQQAVRDVAAKSKRA